jgi:hypothetical protein
VGLWLGPEVGSEMKGARVGLLVLGLEVGSIVLFLERSEVGLREGTKFGTILGK